MSSLKVWVGHMAGDPTACFIVSATTHDEALWVADQLGNIETRSLQEVTQPFAIEIGSHVIDDSEDGEVLVLGSEELHKGNAIYWTDDAAERWADGLRKEPLGGDDSGMIDSAIESAASQHPIDVTKAEPKIHRPRRDEDDEP